MPRILGVAAAVLLVGSLMISAGAGPAVTPQRGGTLVIGRGTEPMVLDSPLATDGPTFAILEHIVETLFELTEDGKVVPVLATGFAASPDGKTFTVRLRTGVRFHDGTPFDAEAVKFNLDRLMDPATRSPWRALFSRITSITAVDPSTVRFVTDVPFAPLLAHFTHSSAGMQSPATVRRAGADYGRTAVVGTGQFKFRSWTRGERVAITRNDDYWGDKPYLDEVQFLVIPDDGARVAALEGGSVHVAERIPPREIDRLRKSPTLTVDVAISLRTIYIAFNVTRPPFNDKRLRQALNYAVNKQAIVSSVLNGTARVSDAPFVPSIQGYSKIMSYEWDMERAEGLLREAGYSRSRPLRAVLHHPSGRYIRDAEISAGIQGLARRVGIELELRTMEWGAYVAHINRPQPESDVQAYMLGWGTVTGDADYGLYGLFHSTQWPPAGFNRGFYKNPRVDELLDRGRTTVDQSERNKIYAEAMRIIMDDAPWLFLHSESQVVGFRNSVVGATVHPAERVMMTKAWLRR